MVGSHGRLSRTLHALEDISRYLWRVVRRRHRLGTPRTPARLRREEERPGARRVLGNGSMDRCPCQREDGKIRVDQLRNFLHPWRPRVFRVSKKNLVV